MKQVHEYPPNWEKLNKHFKVTWGKTVFTYGDTCYCREPLSPDLEAHEEVHTRQQTDPAAWWERYYVDHKFRLEQELEAYQAQYRYLKKTINDRNCLSREHDRLARDLAGPLYGGIVSYMDAFKLIRGDKKESVYGT